MGLSGTHMVCGNLRSKMWVLVNQVAVDALNEAVNDMWVLIAHLEHLARWNGTGAMHEDVIQLRETQERVSEALNTAILWEQA